MTTPEQPRQRFWQQALEELFDHPDARDHAEQTPSGGGHSWRCIPIAEAIESVGLAIEAQARPAVASEGLRAALAALVLAVEQPLETGRAVHTPGEKEKWAVREALQQAHVALDATSDDEALDMDRIESAMQTALQQHDKAWAGELHKCRHSVHLAELFRAALAIEAQARPAVASEGLPLDGVVAELMGVEAHLDEARERLIKANLTLAALASDAGSVGALDVERLARALVTAGPNLKGWVHGTNLNSEDAAAIAAAYDAERQGEQ